MASPCCRMKFESLLGSHQCISSHNALLVPSCWREQLPYERSSDARLLVKESKSQILVYWHQHFDPSAISNSCLWKKKSKEADALISVFKVWKRGKIKVKTASWGEVLFIVLLYNGKEKLDRNKAVKSWKAVPKRGTPWSVNIIFQRIVTMNKGYMLL